MDCGTVLYNEHCASCHGEDLRGKTAEETGLSKNTPDFKKRLSSHSDGDFFWKIRTGRGEMPSFGKDMSDTEIWDIINYAGSDEKQ
ncbi:cytochrome c [Desulfopila sp. IMCC35008]|uniref:c-type cytochrome n=1 Tax=Desulfopila sp. IMCC35008 TaxID=2653858 RepID=UPI0035159EEF